MGEVIDGNFRDKDNAVVRGHFRPDKDFIGASENETLRAFHELHYLGYVVSVSEEVADQAELYEGNEDSIIPEIAGWYNLSLKEARLINHYVELLVKSENNVE